jgi:D-arabinose 1-dehydrogenase-like Zn-dependent alcohol dehydrogenase
MAACGRAGEWVLVHSAGGGVGIAATQIAKRVGAEVFGTASPGKHERILELGADRALDYTRPGWERGIGQFDVNLDAGEAGASIPATRCCDLEAGWSHSGLRRSCRASDGAESSCAHAALQHN